MFLWFGIKQTIAFCSLLKLFVQTKGNCHGEKSTNFPGFAPFCTPSHSMLPDCVSIARGQVSRDRKPAFADQEGEGHLCLSQTS